MPRQVHLFDPPDRFVAGTVGQPGERTFFLQARGAGRTVSVALEKLQVPLLAERLDELLDEVAAAAGRAGDRRAAGRRRRHRAAGHAGRRGVPGRRHGPGLGRRRRAGRGRGAGRRATSRPTSRRSSRTTRRAPTCCGCGSPGRGPRVRRAGPPGRRRRPAAVPALRRCRSTRTGTCARGRTATAAERRRPDGHRSCGRATDRSDRSCDASRRRSTCRGAGAAARRRARARGPAGRRVQRHARTASCPRGRRHGRAASTSRSRGSGRCGTSRTARWPAARSRRTWSRGDGLGRRAADRAARRPVRRRAWCQLWIDGDETVDLAAARRATTCRRCAGWPCSTRSSTTPTARAATCSRCPAGTCTASTTASASTGRTSCAPCCGAGPARRCSDEAVDVLSEFGPGCDGELGDALSALLTRREVPRTAAGSTGC